MSETRRSAYPEMPTGYESLSGIEEVDKDGKIHYNGIIVLGEGDNQYERKFALKETPLEMWGYNQAETDFHRDYPEMWEKMRKMEMQIASLAQLRPETATPTAGTAAAGTNEAVLRPIDNSDNHETPVGELDEAPLPHQANINLVEPAVNDPLDTKLHLTKPVAGTLNNRPLTEAEALRQDNMELKNSQEDWENHAYALSEENGDLRDKKEKLEKQQHQNRLKTLGAVVVTALVAGAAGYFLGHHEGEEHKNGNQTEHVEKGQNSNSHTTEINGVVISELGTSGGFYSQDPHKRLTGVILPKSATLRHNNDGTVSIVDGGTVVIKKAQWDRQGNLSKENRQELTAKNYYLIQGKLGSRYQTIVNKR